MAVTLLARRDRPRGSEFVLDVDGREVTLWKFEHDTSEPVAVTQAWVHAQLQALAAARAAQQAENDADGAATDTQGFLGWLRDNRSRPVVRDLLRPLVRMYREGV